MSGVPSMNLADIGRGFADAALGSQAVFRRALSALSRPGEIHELDAEAETPAGLNDASCALLLTLLDQDTSLWLSPGAASGPAGPYLRFHTGCLLAANAAEADFALVAAADELPALQVFKAGSDEYPERSATVVIQVGGLSGSGGWTLSGPGIDGSTPLHAAGLDSRFVEAWNTGRRAFPCGIDVFLACGNRIAGIPRTTLIKE
jgi:alpha-D-ribose 1-methylphosphonate 5-triphosphate synthase subunit PhnH